jgi:hypothetical protein
MSKRPAEFPEQPYIGGAAVSHFDAGTAKLSDFKLPNAAFVRGPGGLFRLQRRSWAI